MNTSGSQLANLPQPQILPQLGSPLLLVPGALPAIGFAEIQPFLTTTHLPLVHPLATHPVLFQPELRSRPAETDQRGVPEDGGKGRFEVILGLGV